MERRTHLRATRARHRGITAVLAMLYLILFTTLCIGFYASVATSVQVAKNDTHNARALLAAESGVQFMRYHLAHVTIPPNTAQAEVLTHLYTDLKANLEATANFTNMTVGMSNNTISIPAQSGSYIRVDSNDNLGFTASITEWGGNIVCKVVGRSGSGSAVSSKGVSLDFTRQTLPTTAFNYAVASRGKVVMQKGSLTGVSGISNDSIATIMSARTSTPAITISGGTIGGELQITGSGSVEVTGGTVAGTSNIASITNDHTHVVDAPEFPIIDTTIFEAYATATYTSTTGSTMKNIRIPANTGTAANPLKFTGNATIQGILYVESPNIIEFKGNTSLQGFIVFENEGDTSVNQITMSGNFSQGPLPQGAEFDPLRTTTGVAILAPTMALTMSGSVESNVRGNIILGTFNNAGNADVIIDQGTLMTLQESGNASVFNGKNVKFKSTGQNNQPSAGVTYSQKYVPVGGTYQELN